MMIVKLSCDGIFDFSKTPPAEEATIVCSRGCTHGLDGVMSRGAAGFESAANAALLWLAPVVLIGAGIVGFSSGMLPNANLRQLNRDWNVGELCLIAGCLAALIPIIVGRKGR